MPTFRELLIEFDTRRLKSETDGDLILDIEWAIQSILERLANWEEFRDEPASEWKENPPE